MATTTHTPGPWTVDYEGPARLAIVDRADRILVLCNLQCEDGDEDEANARLIAKAPEMRELLEWALANGNALPADEVRALLAEIDGC